MPITSKLKVKNDKARQFYIDECIKENWSFRQLRRQINTFSYERLLASRGNYDVVKDTTNKEPKNNPKDFVKDPYVLEFLDIRDRRFLEKDLEANLLEHIDGLECYTEKMYVGTEGAEEDPGPETAEDE